jgi:hypothetical protein
MSNGADRFGTVVDGDVVGGAVVDVVVLVAGRVVDVVVLVGRGRVVVVVVVGLPGRVVAGNGIVVAGGDVVVGVPTKLVVVDETGPWPS